MKKTIFLLMNDFAVALDPVLCTKNALFYSLAENSNWSNRRTINIRYEEIKYSSFKLAKG